MKLFRIKFEGTSDYVEAETMTKAIEAWHTHRRQHDSGWDDPETPEPDSCALVHDELPEPREGWERWIVPQPEPVA